MDSVTYAFPFCEHWKYHVPLSFRTGEKLGFDRGYIWYRDRAIRSEGFGCVVPNYMQISEFSVNRIFRIKTSEPSFEWIECQREAQILLLLKLGFGFLKEGRRYELREDKNSRRAVDGIFDEQVDWEQFAGASVAITGQDPAWSRREIELLLRTMGVRSITPKKITDATGFLVVAKSASAGWHERDKGWKIKDAIKKRADGDSALQIIRFSDLLEFLKSGIVTLGK